MKAGRTCLWRIYMWHQLLSHSPPLPIYPICFLPYFIHLCSLQQICFPSASFSRSQSLCTLSEFTTKACLLAVPHPFCSSAPPFLLCRFLFFLFLSSRAPFSHIISFAQYRYQITYIYTCCKFCLFSLHLAQSF